MIRLRPHHLLCTQGYSGKGYNESFVAHMNEVVEQLRNVPGTKITLTFSNGDVILLSADPDAQDRAVVLLKYNNKTTAFAIEGYQVMKNIAAAVSPEGFSEENPLA